MATSLKNSLIPWMYASQVPVYFFLFISCSDGHTIKRKSAPVDVAYFCPMDTMVNSVEQGKCPECKMKLRKNPVYSGVDKDSVVVTTIGDTILTK